MENVERELFEILGFFFYVIMNIFGRPQGYAPTIDELNLTSKST